MMEQTTIVNMEKNERLLSLGAGAAMIVYGLIRRSLATVAFIGAGAFFLYRGVTGHCPGYEWLDINRAVDNGKRQMSAGEQQTFRNAPPASVQESDRVTEAAWESFPTSDPPAWTMGREEQEEREGKEAQ